MGDLVVTMGTDHRRILTTLRRKTLVVSDRLAVVWAGSQELAERVLDRLYESRAEISDRSELEHFLTSSSFEGHPGAGLKLAGWSGPDHAFHWDSTSPGHVTWGDPWFFGSGGQAADDATQVARSSPTDDLSPVVLALDATSRLMVDEIRGHRHVRRDGFGWAYDLVHWTGTRFETVSDVMYEVLTVTFSPTGALLHAVLDVPSIRCVEARGFLVLQVLRHGRDPEYVAVGPVAPVRDPTPAMKFAERLDQGNHWARPRYRCLMLELTGPGLFGQGVYRLVPFCIPYDRPFHKFGRYRSIGNEEVLIPHRVNLEGLYRFAFGGLPRTEPP
jgi:hypothetical protein